MELTKQIRSAGITSAGPFLWLLFYLLLTGCAIPKAQVQDDLVINRGVVENLTGEDIERIQILHLPTRAAASISPVLARQRAEIGFQERELKAESAILTWVQSGKRHQVEVQLPAVSKKTAEKQVFVLRYQITRLGTVVALIVPAEQYW